MFAILLSMLLTAPDESAPTDAHSDISVTEKAQPIEKKFAFLSRVLKTPWPAESGKPRPRVVREEGKITRLLLNGMQFQERDIEALKEFESLKGLVLCYSTITDAQLAALKELPALESLVLNHTEIGNEGVQALAEFPSLRSLCLFEVKADAETIEALQKKKRGLQIGYVIRKPGAAEQE